MKKTKDEMRAEYNRSDFTKLERGKFYKEVAKGTSVVLLDPAIASYRSTNPYANEPCNIEDGGFNSKCHE
ncbi:MAG: hypothetical protein Q7S69_00380 [Nitrosomonadaceae bacterium]|nr:hypothetical protein [Nitrosomonadaceae bacterium]